MVAFCVHPCGFCRFWLTTKVVLSSMVSDSRCLIYLHRHTDSGTETAQWMIHPPMVSSRRRPRHGLQAIIQNTPRIDPSWQDANSSGLCFFFVSIFDLRLRPDTAQCFNPQARHTPARSDRSFAITKTALREQFDQGIAKTHQHVESMPFHHPQQ